MNTTASTPTGRMGYYLPMLASGIALSWAGLRLLSTAGAVVAYDAVRKLR